LNGTQASSCHGNKEYIDDKLWMLNVYLVNDMPRLAFKCAFCAEWPCTGLLFVPEVVLYNFNIELLFNQGLTKWYKYHNCNYCNFCYDQIIIH